MRILHVLSSDFLAGSVIYTLSIAEAQAAQGHDVFILSDTFFNNKSLKSFALPVSKRSLKQRLHNVRFIKKFIRQNKIDIIHAHSRAASWVAHYAVKNTHIPMLSTAHGILHKQGHMKKVDVYGSRIIAICHNLKEQYAADKRIDESKIVCIPNGIDDKLLDSKNKHIPTPKKVISVIGRFNGPKGENFCELICNVFPQLLSQHTDLAINLVGNQWEDLPENGKKEYARLHKLYGERIEYLEYRNDVLGIMQNSLLVIGAGRVALESLFSGISVFAIGEAVCHGIITPKNIHEAMESNFGDIKKGIISFTPNSEHILREINSFLETPHTPFDFSEILAQYKLSVVSAKIFKLYETVIIENIHKKPIPVLMYHKVTDGEIETAHKIYVTRDNFEKHVRFFKRRGLTSITFKDYLAFARAQKPAKDFPAKPFILTFDDGYLSTYANALPLCSKYGFTPVIFLLGDFNIQKNNWDSGEEPSHGIIMQAEQKQQLADAGWEIGAHTLSHPRLTQLKPQQAFEEIKNSKTSLEKGLHTEVISFAYPYGDYDNNTEALVQQAGFEFGIATDTGGMTIEENRFAIFRANIFPHENAFSLYKKTSSWYRKYYKKKRGK